MADPKPPPTVSTVERPKYLFMKEVAEELRITYNGLWSIIASGKGPPVLKLNNSVRIPRDGYEKWVKSRTK
jgi:predicted DNA-binding transcriptional regulator AlpA